MRHTTLFLVRVKALIWFSWVSSIRIINVQLSFFNIISTKFNCLQAKAEQEEEFISNTLLKKIQELKKEKENLALNYEQEEECLTNDLSRKLDQVYSGNLNTGKNSKGLG